MLILVPPSEGKASGRRGWPLDLDRLSFPELTPTRRKVIEELISVSAQPDALDVLDAPKGAADQVEANTRIESAATLPASALYTGVLYDALGYNDLSASARRRAGRRLVVISALFGALRPADRVPSYRLSMGVRLPALGPLAAVWRDGLEAVLPAAAGRGLILDMRSSTYVAAWRPSGEIADRTVAIHVVRDEAGRRSVVSHMAKHTRGLVARHVLETGLDPRTPEDLADALGTTYRVDLDGPQSGPRRLEIVEPG